MDIDGVADHPARRGSWDRFAADFTEGHMAYADDHEAVVDHVKGTASAFQIKSVMRCRIPYGMDGNL
jgi:hypothetical protein